MAQVSIGQVENLSRAITAIEICAREAETEAARSMAEVEQKLGETEEFLNESIQLVQQKEANLATAQALVVAASAALATASSALAATGTPAAAAALAAASAALIAAEQNLEKAVRELDLARQREEIARANLQAAQNLNERVRNECYARINVINTISEEGRSRLKHAWEALEAYLNTNSDARAVYGYLNRRSTANRPVTHQATHNRMNLTPPQQDILIRYLAETDPVFRDKIADYRNALTAAMGQAERDAILVQILKNLGDTYAEKIAAIALQSLGDGVRLEISYTIEDERKIFIDLLISNLKAPIVLEEGEETVAPKGGLIAVEIETGRKKLLDSRDEYMEYRAEAEPDAPMVLCIRDIKDLSPDEAAELSEAIKAADSPLLAMLLEMFFTTLPDRELIEEALRKIITAESENAES